AASQRLDTWHLYAQWELDVPMVPQFIWIYLSVYVCCFLPLFVLTAEQIRAFGRSFLKCTLIAGVIFLLFPAKLGFARERFVEGYDAIFQGLYRLDQPYNLVPSLHVALATLVVMSILTYVDDRRLKWFLNLWLVLVMMSVVLIRQHHLLDIVTGFSLAWGCVWHTNKKAAEQPLSQTVRTS
ncbi:MAG: phosphatase PAP2 family protein, partial [Bdellovibrionales bacterium]|nr:phosphatase PAP2 family protein [Bdellovibrionales bacterium]